MAPAGAKGGAPDLGLGVRPVYATERTSKVDTTTVCDGLSESDVLDCQ